MISAVTTRATVVKATTLISGRALSRKTPKTPRPCYPFSYSVYLAGKSRRRGYPQKPRRFRGSPAEYAPTSRLVETDDVLAVKGTV